MMELSNLMKTYAVGEVGGSLYTATLTDEQLGGLNNREKSSLDVQWSVLKVAWP